MANLPEEARWEEGVHQWEVTDPVMGGPDGIDNKPIRQLANRTKYLKEHLETGQSEIDKALKKRILTSAISSAIDSTSTDTVASSGAVKQAYDRASQAINAANTKVSQSHISNAVNSTSTTTVASSAAVKTAYDKAVQASNAAGRKMDSYPLHEQFSSCETIDKLVAKLKTLGALNNNSRTFKGSWRYDGNSDISTPYGAVELAGSVIEAIGDSSCYHIRITRPTTGTGGRLVTYIYNFQGSGYSPGWAKYEEIVSSNSVSSSSTSTIATSQAVKTAYDRASSAISAAGSKIPTSAINSSVSSTSTTNVASSKAVKTAYDKAVNAAINAPNCIRGGEISGTGWKSVAKTTHGHGLCKLSVFGVESGCHTVAVFMISWCYGQAQITQIAGETFSNSDFNAVRVLHKTSDRTYGGSIIQIYAAGGSFYYELESCSGSVSGNYYNTWSLYTGGIGGYSETIKLSDVDRYALQSTSFRDNTLIGVPIPYPSATPPAGYLAMKGQAISQSTYPNLYALYGSHLPDMRGEFIRGWDNGRGVDNGRAIKSHQGDAMRNIKGNLGWIGDRANGGATAPFSSVKRGNFAMNSGRDDNWMDFRDFDASRSVPTANENRPRNIAFNYICLAG